MPMPISNEEHDRFKVALCERLGIDPAKVDDIRAEVDSFSGARIEWTGKAHMSQEEFTELFNSLRLRIG